MTPLLTEREFSGKKPPSERIADVSSAQAIVRALIQEDFGASTNRARVQAMLDGAPPYDPAKLRATGQDSRTNLNFGEGSAILESALTGYYDVVDSVDTLLRVHLGVGEVNERREWEGIFAEEFTRMLREWPAFHPNFQLLAHQFVAHGVGFSVFPDDTDWRWFPAGLQEVKLPRGTRPFEDDAQYAVCLRNFSVSSLYQYIRDEAAAKERGWNVEVVRKVLRDSAPSVATDWEGFQAKMKNNDLFVSTTSSTPIALAMIWVKEFSGQISHYIVPVDSPVEDYLFKSVGTYSRMGQCFVMFPYGVGSNGYLHSIRGLAHKLFPFVSVSNQLRSQTVDGARLASSLIVQPVDEANAEEFALTYYGGLAVLKSGVQVVERNLTNVATSSLPVINDLVRVMSANTGTYQSRAVTPEGQERTKFEVQAQLQQEAVLSAGALNLFYQPWKRLLAEQVRRVVNPFLTVDDPGGEEALLFRSRCLARGFPPEAFLTILSVEPVRSIGAGSAGLRAVAIDEMMNLAPALDAVGRNNLLRDRVASRLGYDQASRYVPKMISAPRLTLDERLADAENAQLLVGLDVSVAESDHNELHADRHLTGLAAALEALQKSQPTINQVTGLAKLLAHAGEHIQIASTGQPSSDSPVFQLLKVYHELDSQVQKIMEAIPEDEKTMTPEQRVLIETHRLKNQIMLEAHRTKMSIKLSEAQQRQALRDAQAAAKMQTRFDSR